MEELPCELPFVQEDFDLFCQYCLQNAYRCQRLKKEVLLSPSAGVCCFW